MKKNYVHDRRKNFVSTFTQTPIQFDSFTTTIKDVLQGETTDTTALKQSAKKTELLVLNRVDFCNDIGFYAFQTYLLDVFEQREPVIFYIKEMPTTVSDRHIKDLGRLWRKCNYTADLPKAVHLCYHIQEDITNTLTANRNPNLSTEIFEGHENIFGDDDITNKFIDEEAQRDQDAAAYRQFVEAVRKTYTFSSKGCPVPKRYFEGLKERFGKQDN